MMMEKKDILYMIYCSKTGTDVFDLLYESGLRYSELKPFLDEWAIKKILQTKDGKHYKFIGDGRMFSGKYKQEKLKCFAKGLIEKSVNEEWDREDDSEEVDEEKEKFLQELRAELEVRRRELIKRLQAELNRDDEEDEMENEDDDEDSLGEDNVEGDHEESDLSMNAEGLSECILDSLKKSIAVRKYDENYLIEIDGVDLYATDAKFELFPYEGKVYLCDQGSTIDSLKETDALNDEARGRITNIAAESGAEIIDEKLCVEVTSPERTLACLFRLYAVMERVYHIRDNIF